ADALRPAIARLAAPLYPRDLATLAIEIRDYPDVVAQTNHNAIRVAAFLEQHPRIAEVYWSQRPATRENYAKISRGPDCVGAIISFTVRGPLAPFYDALNLPKGPSFGMKTTLICPFMYLAHYDLVSTEAHRPSLASHGIDPELLRLSVGTEPAEDIIASLDAALASLPPATVT